MDVILGVGSLVLGLAMIAAAVVAAVVPVFRFAMAWWRIHTACESVGVYDRRPDPPQHSGGDAPAAPRPRTRSRYEPGMVVPDPRAGMREGLPNRWLVKGRTVLDEAKFAELLAAVERYSGRPWTLGHVGRSRWLELCQAPPLPAVPPAPPTPVSPWLLPVGCDHDHQPVWWQATEQYHCLVVGRTGFGKSSFALWLTAQVVARTPHWRIVVVDPELDDLATTLVILRRVDAELDRRDPDAEPRTRWLVVVDEFDTVMEVTTKAADPDDYETRKEVRRLIRKLLQRGGKRGLHVLALAQDPRAEAVGRGIRSKFGARLAGWLDASEYNLVLDTTVPHSRRGPRGRGWWLAEGGIPVEVQVHSTARQRRESEGPSETTVTRKILALTGRKGR